MKSTRVTLAAVVLTTGVIVPCRGQGYHQVASYVLGGEGGWDYVTLDTAGHRLFIARQTRVMVVDADNGVLLGEISGLAGAHGVAIAYEAGHGFVTSGRDSSVTMFDLKSLAVLSRMRAATGADAILYDAGSMRVFSFNGTAHSASVFDAASGARVGTIDLGGTPEFGVSAGDGKLYVNLEDRSAVAEIDASGMRVTRRWSITPCESPTGLALDRAHHRLFSGCHNRLMAISDASAGALVTTLPIGAGVDGNAFDAATGYAFSSNGEGTLTVVHEDGVDRFRVTQTATTMPGARTMALDPQSHRIYLVSARFGPVPADSTATNPRRRSQMIPGSFTLLVLEP